MGMIIEEGGLKKKMEGRLLLMGNDSIGDFW